tara:strand:- start:1648 stop:2781 length:1134 start_codon:yes stop_codon:yes gene_type:complete
MIKLNHNDIFSSRMAHPLIEKIKGDIILDYRNRTRNCNNPIPQRFNDKIIFQSFKSFQQRNGKLGKKIHRIVANMITTDSINAIGGESYLYSTDSLFYTNSIHCYNDCIFNGNKNCQNIDYNKAKIKLNMVDTVVNMSKLNLNIVKQINNSASNRIIIINCHHKDFWKKMKYFTNYKIVRREKLIDHITGFFVTVTRLVRKSFISLGGNCSVTHHMKKLKMRNQAFPFDWSEIKISKVVSILENNFSDIDNLTITKFSDNHNSYLVKNQYMKYAHEVVKETDIDKFKNSIVRRVDRFNRIKNPTFVRIETFNFNDSNMYSNYWKKIINNLDSRFENYKIILISNIKVNNSKIEWYPYTFNSEWQNNQLDWRQIFNLV